MAHDRPGGPIAQSAREASLSGVERELKGEQAVSLGRYGRAVERTLAALREAGASDADARQRLVRDAAEAVWRYFIQREALGLYNHDLVVKHYGIPGEVLARVGSGSL
ncbi:DUF6665 family protein [Pedomonas sp. V897]|uniref:DUF6665 family protein n=1 Tax=Pedomonas sp. V897 TaxID=3446482 RepID=UPI003EDFA58A